MGSLVTERNELEEGLNVIKQAKLEFANPVNEMYEALQRQYIQVRTIKLQGKAQDYVKKVLHDSKFFCILTKLITQAIGQSRNAKQQSSNIKRVHKWYTSNLHKLHFAEQPAFRGSSAPSRSSTPSRSSAKKSASVLVSTNVEKGHAERTQSSNLPEKIGSARQPERAQSSVSTRKTSLVSTDTIKESTSSNAATRKTSQDLEGLPSRPKSVTWREVDTGSTQVVDTGIPQVVDEAADAESRNEGSGVADDPGHQKSLDMVHSLADKSTPYYNLVDDDTYIDTVLSSNQIERTTSQQNIPTGRPFTPVVNDYIEQIQREVNKVQGHPSDLYPELFTPHIVNAIINETEEGRPISRLSSAERGRSLSEQSTEQFFSMADAYRPNSVKKFTSLQPRKDVKPRPKSSIPATQSRPSSSMSNKKSLQIKDVISLADFASAEISYEKESGVRAVLNRPKDTPPVISQHQIEAPPSTATQREVTPLAILPAESPGSPTNSQSYSIVDWRGQVTPTCSDSQQEVFKSHSYARHFTRLQGAKGRSVGVASAGYRPKTAPVTWHSKAKPDQCHAGSERIPQAASNTLSGLDDKTTKSLLSVSNIKTVAPRRHRPDISLSENYGNFYLDYLHCDETLPPTSVYEYSSYPYEHEPFPKSYQFMAEDSAGRSPSPPPVEYFTIVNSVAPDLERIRYKSKHEVRVERANTPASSVKTKDSSLPAADVNREESGETTPTKNAVSESGNEGEDETFKSEKQLSRMRLMKSLVPSPLFQFTAYPTPRGGVLREKSPGRSRTVTSANNSNTSGLEKAVTAISFEPPFHIGNFNKPREATKSAGKLRTSTDKTNPNAIIQPMRTAPSIPSVHSAFGSRSPRLTRNHPFSGEHDRSAHRQLNPLEYLKKVQGMRAEDVYIEDGKREDTGKLSSYFDVRPMSSHLDLRHTQADLSVHNAIKFDRERIQTPVEQLCTSPAFITESNEDGSYHPPEQRCNSARPKSSLSSASNPRSSRPIPQYMKTEHWEKVDADTQRQKEAAAAVSIQKIFRGYVSRKVYLNLRRDYRAEQENKRISAIRIQRSWRQHRNRLKQIYSQPTVSPVTLQRVKDFKSLQLQQEAQRESKRMAEIEQMKRQEQESKETISVIGPHVEIYSAYHPLKYGASKKEVEKAIVVIQKNVRGMQCRQYLNVLKEKAKDHASTWAEWVSYYKKFLKRILHRRGIDKPDIVINLEQMKKFMSQKKRYESVFDRRAFGGELEEDEIVQFFRECDLMPANHEIEHAIDLVFKGKPRSKKTTFKKREVLDVVFEIYKPEGTGIINDRKSTWLHPIVDGEDAMKMLGSDMVEPTPLGPCIQLVADSMRERKEKAAEEERLRIIANQKELRKCQAESAANSSQPTILDNSQPSEPATLQIFSSEPMTSSK